MKTFLILLVVAVASAQYANYAEQYGPPPSQYEGYGPPSINHNEVQVPPQHHQQSEEEEEVDTRPLKTTKHIFVHIAPDDVASGAKKIIKAPIEKERQVNIIFVKAPAPAAPDQQVVEIPHDGGRKTLVYVLLKKNEDTPHPEFKLPGPTQASKPEIYFIKYRDGNKKDAAATGPGAGAGGAAGAYGPPPPAPAPSKKNKKNYGPPPPPPAPTVAAGGYQKK